MNKEANINLLNQIYQSCIFGIDALNVLKNKINKMELQISVNEQLDKYLKIKERVEQEYIDYKVTPPEKNEELVKTLMSASIDVNELSTSEIESLANNIVVASNKEVAYLNEALEKYHDTDDNVIGIAKDLINLDLFLVTGFFYNYPNYLSR
jgi:rRNA maturation endonuclease Nob1